MSSPAAGDRRDEEEHEEHVNHEAWVIPYADMVTLLMALFLMLYALSTLDLAKFEAMSESLGTSLGSSEDLIQPLDGDEGGPLAIALDGTPEGAQEGVDPVGDITLDVEPVIDPQVEPQVGPRLTPREVQAEEALEREEAQALAVAVEQNTMNEAQERITAAAEAAGLGDVIEARLDPRGLVVTIVSDRVLFAPGSATIQPAGHEALGVVAGALASLPNQVAVEGHTDNRPINTRAFPSNWELSTTRATTVLRELVGAYGLPGQRLSASGYADERSIADNTTSEGRSRNRRVELVVFSEADRTAAALR